MGNFIVSALKYRPAQFDEVLGQKHITDTLKNAIKNDHLAHAFLFCGPRGVGKTSCARILAKVINCDQPSENFESCGTCPSCVSFKDNASFNIFEMDGASNNKVDNIHQLLDQVRVAPQPGKTKVFIIDEVHMLSASAFNAFLKTLEEPPKYALFILATTEKHKIIPTILSRCQIYDFNRIRIQEMVEQLKSICVEENIQAEDNALQLIAAKADGAMRDALSIFDRMASFRQGNILYSDVIQNLNILDYDYFFKYIESFLSEDLSGIMMLTDEILNKGFEGSALILGLSEHLRQLLVCQNSQTISLLMGSEDLKQRYIQQAQYTDTAFVLSALDILNDCDIHYAKARNKRLHIEIALSKITYIHRRLQVDLLVDTQEKKTKHAKHSQGGIPEIVEAPQKKSEAVPPQGAKSEIPKTKQENPKEKQEIPKSPPSPPDPTLGKIAQKFAIPGLSIPSVGSLKNIEASLVEKEAQLNQESILFHIDDVQKIWNQHTENCPSPSVKQILKHAGLSIDGKTLKVAVGSQLGKTAVQQETGLMDSIRKFFNDTDIILEIVIDPKRNGHQIQKVKKLLTDKEKYALVAKKNPSLTVLQQKFDLRFDKD